MKHLLQIVVLISLLIVSGVVATAQINVLNDRINKDRFNNQITNEIKQRNIETADKHLQKTKHTKANGDWYEPDTVYVFYANFVGINRYICSYNQQGYCIMQLYENLENDTWVNDTKSTYTYDENNNMLTYLCEYWHNNS